MNKQSLAHPARAGLGALCFALTAVSTASGANILVNPGFESGDTTGWVVPDVPSGATLGVSSEEVHAGGFALKLTDELFDRSTAIDQSITPTPTSMITAASIWYRRFDDTPATQPRMNFFYSDASIASVNLNTPTTDWTQVNLMSGIVPGKTLVGIELRWGGPFNNGDLAVRYFDDFVIDVGAAPACPADLNGDGGVGAPDLAQLLGSWNASGTPADLNGDGTVNAADLALLLGSWGVCPA